ncbi:MAG: hypothetical protein GKR98_15590 [Boseongicola sp.]|nr:MAG: hypothetical protein GKR98_15590 [Boseongicola sp.]
MKQAILITFCAVFLGGCAIEDAAEVPLVPLGDFRLGHNIAIADNVVRGPFSREMSETDLEASVQNAVAERLRKYDGNGLYHLGIVVGGVTLAQPGIPVVYSPKSVLLLDVTIFDNRTREPLNTSPKRIQVGEGFANAVPFLGSGNVREPEQQLENLSANAARAIEEWLQDNPDWFQPRADQIRVPFDIRTPAPDVSRARPAETVN